ncbi:MAG: AAA-like domain-containing protein [Rhizonema sp. PD38]|nr:AAA-like domain-containing protein [Rhizonema sp. PD38]
MKIWVEVAFFIAASIADTEEPTYKSQPGNEKQQKDEQQDINFSDDEYPTGEVPLNSHFYIQRSPIEQRCYEEISKPGSLIRIKASQQTGKSSLLARILDQAKSQGDTIVTVDLGLAESEFFTNLSKFLRWFCDNVILELTTENQELQTKLVHKLDEHWKLAKRIGSMKTCKDYFERYIFPEISQPITLALEEVDKVFEYPKIYKDFFGLLRSLHEEAKRRDIWKKLRLVIVHSTEAYVPLDINQSPFNVGLAVELPDFTENQVKDLAQRYKVDLSPKEVESLMAMVGGQPFLVRLALYKIANAEITLAELLQTSPTSDGIYKSHLQRIESILAQYPELEAGMKEAIATTSQVELDKKTRSKLNALGLGIM